ncbi:cupin domain-containing protein [Larkinella sp. C7]|uniref:cupin domain-containing protein n=1 Tax=Larkinella sp. C7 TaxID=2576607 RepID=UPI0011110AFE|nr:cupin domain-containing protein [Larkinella sp. C7]
MNKQLVCLGHQMTLHNPSGNFDMIEGLTPPNVPGPPPHYHAGYSELFYVLEGKMEFMLDGKTVLVQPGESIDVPANTLHTFKNAGDGPCRWMNIHSPKGFLSFFEKFGVDAMREDAFAQSVDGQIIQAVLQEAADYDMHIKLP